MQEFVFNLFWHIPTIQKGLYFCVKAREMNFVLVELKIFFPIPDDFSAKGLLCWMNRICFKGHFFISIVLTDRISLSNGDNCFKHIQSLTLGGVVYKILITHFPCESYHWRNSGNQRYLVPTNRSKLAFYHLSIPPTHLI